MSFLMVRKDLISLGFNTGTPLGEICSTNQPGRASIGWTGTGSPTALLSHCRSQESWCERRTGQSQVDCVENRLSVLVCSGDITAHLAKGE